MGLKKISVITPCFNEEGNIKNCYERVRSIFNKELKGYKYEHIFCDNNSQDLTLTILREISKNDKNIKIIVNSRNFGGPNSMFNGVIAATGDAIIPMLPADLQDPPELIIDFIGYWEKGYDIVFGIRSKREESFFMRSIRSYYYKFITKFANINIPLNAGDFSLIDKKIQSILKTQDDYSPYLRGMIAYSGFNAIEVPYTWKARNWGVSKYKIYSLIDVGLNGLISFSNLPMRLCMISGFFISFSSIIYALFLLARTVIYPSIHVVSGIPTITISLFFFSGINLFFLGVLGEYITAIHSQVRKKPLVIEKERINFD